MKKLLLSLTVFTFLFSVMTVNVFADSEQYLILGKDLTSKEKATVLSLLGVDDESKYNVSYVTNEEEHQYLDNYLSKKIIGTRALSSALIEKVGTDDGITVTTNNINYCTAEMYQNALITAGVKDVSVSIAGPFQISGTAALVATIKSYEIMTGETLKDDNVDAANNEIVVTSDLGQEVGTKDAAELMATLKQKVASLGDDYTREKGEEALDDIEDDMDIHISDDTKEKILDLMDKIKNTDISLDDLKTQAKNIYDNIKDYIDDFQNSGIFDSFVQGVKDFIDSIIDFFN